MFLMICQPGILHPLPLNFVDADISLEGENDFRNQGRLTIMYQMTRKIIQISEKR